MARVLVLVFAVIAAGVAAWLASTLVSSEPPVQEAAPAPQIETDEVLVAAAPISVGERVDGGKLRWQTWPSDALANGYITRKVEPEAKKLFDGAVARMSMLANEPVTPSKLVRADNASFMAARLSPGMRAVSVRISPESGAGGFILPGDKVDVILTREIRVRGESQPEIVSDTVLSGVRVLAIDQTYSETGEDAEGAATVGKTATLELTPQQAETLAMAKAMGDITLSLRALSDGATGMAPAQPSFLFSDKRRGGGDGSSVIVVRYGVATRETPRLEQE